MLEELLGPTLSRWAKRLLLPIVLLLALAILMPFGFVQAGERGVLLQWGAVIGKIFQPGLYFRVPIVHTIAAMDVRIQKEEVTATAASKDLQTVRAVVALNFHLNPDSVASVYREVGPEYKIRIIDPALQEAVKASTAKFTAEELITKRESVREDIKTHLAERLDDRGFLVDEFNIVDFDFSNSFNQAIEAKVTAEQNALAAKNKLEQVKFEAQQKVAEAKGKAEAIQIESEALKSNPRVLELRAIEKWNGELPQVTGGAIPFINIK